jgi:hypothetical protein
MVNQTAAVIRELELRKLDIKREKAKLILDKCIWLYFLFMIVGVFGFINGYVSPFLLNLIVIAAFAILIIGTLPYTNAVSAEEKTINKFISGIKR